MLGLCVGDYMIKTHLGHFFLLLLAIVNKLQKLFSFIFWKNFLVKYRFCLQ